MATELSPMANWIYCPKMKVPRLPRPLEICRGRRSYSFLLGRSLWKNSYFMPYLSRLRISLSNMDSVLCNYSTHYLTSPLSLSVGCVLCIFLPLAALSYNVYYSTDEGRSFFVSVYDFWGYWPFSYEISSFLCLFFWKWPLAPKTQRVRLLGFRLGFGKAFLLRV